MTPHRDASDNQKYATWILQKLAEFSLISTKSDLNEITKLLDGAIISTPSGSLTKDDEGIFKAALEGFLLVLGELHNLRTMSKEELEKQYAESKVTREPTYAGAPYDQENDEDDIRHTLDRLETNSNEYCDENKEKWK